MHLYIEYKLLVNEDRMSNLVIQGEKKIYSCQLTEKSCRR